MPVSSNNNLEVDMLIQLALAKSCLSFDRHIIGQFHLATDLSFFSPPLSVCRRCKRTHVSIKKNNGNIEPAVVYYLPLAVIFVMFVIGAWMGDSVCMIQLVLSSLTITTKKKSYS